MSVRCLSLTLPHTSHPSPSPSNPAPAQTLILTSPSPSPSPLKAVFKALITATNEVGEIRIQFHVVTDGHDQMIAPIEALLETMNAYGQDPTELLTTDKPAEDKAFFQTIIPSLKATQDRLDQAAPPAPPTTDALPACDVDPANCKLCRTPQEIATQVDAARNVVKALPPQMRVMSLDAEWDVMKNQQGMVVGSGTVAVIQLSFKESEDGPIRALVLQVCHAP